VQIDPAHRAATSPDPARLRPQHAEARLREPPGDGIEIRRAAAERRQQHDQAPAALRKHFDRDVTQVGGSILLVSNFTVSADARKGRRPTLEAAADPETGRKLFEQFVEVVKHKGVPVATGVFQADMLVQIENDGPATFIVSTDNT
jgi:hypothetical protein